jgi:hypothetical protein
MGFRKTHDPNGTCYFGPPVKPKIETEHHGTCMVYTFPASRIVRHGEPSEAA